MDSSSNAQDAKPSLTGIEITLEKQIMNSATSFKKSSLAIALTLGLGAGATQAAFFAPGSTGTIELNAGCFTFGQCAIGGTGNIADNGATANGVGSGIAGDGLVGIFTFTVGGDGNSITITGFSQDTYPGTAGGNFALDDASLAGMVGNVSDSGVMTLDLTGRVGNAQFFPGLGTSPWNIDNAASANVEGETGLQEIWTTGSTDADDPAVAGQQSILNQTGAALGETATGIWTGTLVSSGNVGAAWGPFDGTPYTEQFDITVTGTPAPIMGPDCTPDNFSFAAQTDVGLSQTITSASQTITGIDPGCAISVTDGEYQIDVGGWTSAPGTINNGQSVEVRHTSSSLNSTSVITALTVGTLTRNFTSTTVAAETGVIGSNFTMLDPAGGAFGGTNDVQATWDGLFNASESDPVTPATAHMTLASLNPATGQPTPFFQFPWTAHHIRVFDEGGPYTINTECTVPQLEAGTCAPNADPSKNYVFTVGTGQVGAHMLFDWSTSTNIDVVIVWDQNLKFAPSPMYTAAAGCNNPETLWDLMSSDWDGDGQNGSAMIDGPFIGYKANFNVMLTGTALACGDYVPSVNVGDPSTPGCSISAKPLSGIERGDWWLLAGFLVWLGGIRIRYKRHQIKA
jgi:hypothetical protein